MGSLLAILLLAQAHEIQPPRENASQQERCQDLCRKVHCDQWNACYNIDDSTAREKCKDRASDDEQRCRKSCGESRT